MRPTLKVFISLSHHLIPERAEETARDIKFHFQLFHERFSEADFSANCKLLAHNTCSGKTQ
jgi:hypothetical protein